MQASEARVRTSTFWAAAMANLGLEVSLPQEYPVVTVITKKGRRAIENAEQIAERLRERFPEAEIALVDGNSLNAVPLKKRVTPQQPRRLGSEIPLILCTALVLTPVESGAAAQEHDGKALQF